MQSSHRTLEESLVAVVVTAALLALAPSASAAPPANDDFAAAQAVGPGLPVLVSGTNVDATAEPGEPSVRPQPQANASVWYSWEPTQDAMVKLDLCESPYETQAFFGVFTGTQLNALTPVAGSLDDPVFFKCKVVFEANAGTTYKIAVDSWGDDAGGGIVLDLHQLDPPPNDDFDQAEEIQDDLPVLVPGTNFDSTREEDEPNHYGPNGPPTRTEHSVWYEWTPTENVEAAISLCSPTGGALAAVYTGTEVANLTPVSQPADCRLHFPAVAGTTYMIAVDGSQEEPFTLDLHEFSPPANDAFANAVPLGEGAPVAGTTTDAGTEPNEPWHFMDIGQFGRATVWYRWTPAANGVATIDTCASDLDTLIAVYTGANLTGLTKTAWDDDGCDPDAYGVGSLVSFNAVAGRTYWIVVDSRGTGEFSVTGEFSLRARLSPSGSQPSAPIGKPTGKRAAALKKCKKRKGPARKKCTKRAKRLPA